MKKAGYIKLHRKEEEWLRAVSDAEFRFYVISRLNTVWDKRNRWFGTFDARIKIIKEEWFPDWCTGKICTTRKKLFELGFYTKVKDHRFSITNFDSLMLPGTKYEKYVQSSEVNFLNTEDSIQENEKINEEIAKSTKQLSLSKSVYYDKNIGY